MTSNVYSEAEWTRMRPHIVKLYTEEEKPLKQVAEIMNQTHGFRPTLRMYTYRIQKWGLNKYYNEAQAVQMYLLKQERAAKGKDSNFYINGKLVDWAQVEKYLYRRPDLESKIRAGMIKLSNSVPGIECLTPPSSPVHASNALRYTDEVLRLLKGYYCASFEHGTRSTIDQHDVAATLKWYMTLFQARTMITSEAMQLGFQLLGQCLDHLKHIVRGEEATLAFALYDLATLFDQRHEALAFELIRHTHNMLNTIFGDNHPFVCLFRRLARLSEKDRFALIATTSEAIVDDFKQRDNTDVRTMERLQCHRYVLLDYMGGEARSSTALFPDMNTESLDATAVSYLCRHISQLLVGGDLEQAEAKLPLVLHWLESPASQQDPCRADMQLGYSKIMGFLGFLKSQNIQPGSLGGEERLVPPEESVQRFCGAVQDDASQGNPSNLPVQHGFPDSIGGVDYESSHQQPQSSTNLQMNI